MDKSLKNRLNQIPDRILSDEFLHAKGLGNEIGFWIFDYNPEAELEVRRYITILEAMLANKHSHLNVVHVNLLSVLSRYLGERGFLDKAFDLQKKKGDAALLKALSGPLHTDKFSRHLVEACAAESRDIILVSGIGSVWPLLRAHNLLNSLHARLGHKPVVLFYPGEYTGQSMRLFGKIPSNNYYRAFKLVPS